MNRFFFLTIILIFVSCSSDDETPTLPVLSTNNIIDVSFTSATSGGNVTSDGGANVTARGVVWSVTQNPTIDLPTKTNDGSGRGSFTSNIFDLTANTTYYVRAYATNSVGTAYGGEVSFTTDELQQPQPLFYLAENGITCKCENVSPGDIGIIDGIEYEAVDRDLLIQRRDEGADLSKVCTSLVTNMNGMFGSSNFNQPIENWDVSNVTNMEGMFANSSFNQPIGNWDVGNVRIMRWMFAGSQFNQPIGSWDVSNVENMLTMFENSSFNQPINNWDVSNVFDMQGLFWDSQFNQPIDNWDVSNVINMRFMFRYSQFNQPIGNWDVSNVTNMDYMFEGSEFNQPIGNWDVSNVASMLWMFRYSQFNQPIGNWGVGNVISMSNMFEGSQFNQPIGNWNVSNVTSMFEMFRHSQFNQNISSWCVTDFPSEPDGFSEGAPLTPENKPIWGTCP